MKRFFAGSMGFTVTELIVGALFAMMVIGYLYGFYRHQLFSLLSQEAKTTTLEDARGALDLMSREIRNAGAWAGGSLPSGCAKIALATVTAIRVQADLDGNGDCYSATGDDITYALSGSTPTCPGVSIRRNGDCLIPNVLIPAGADFLTYYRAGSTTALSHPISDLSAPRRVRIAFGVQIPNPNPSVGGSITSALSSSVELRN